MWLRILLVKSLLFLIITLCDDKDNGKNNKNTNSIKGTSEHSEIKVLMPKAGDVWKLGKYVWVNWDLKSAGNGPNRIDLDLYRGPGDGILLENISFGVPIGESASEWIVKKDLQQGNDYFVVITSPEKRGFRVVSERFSIGKNGSRGQGNEASVQMQINSQWLLSFLLIGVGMFIL